MQFNKYILFSFLVILLASSCTTSFDIKTKNSDPVIVIYGCITDMSQQHFVEISRSSPYFDNQPNASISNALVVVESSDNQTFLLDEDLNKKGKYLFPDSFVGTPGVTYHLKVTVDFNSDGIPDDYEATTTMPVPVGLDSIRIVPTKIMSNNYYALRVFGQDPPTTDFYIAWLVINDTIVRNKISQMTYMDDKMFNGQAIDDATIMYIADARNDDDDDDDDDFAEVYPNDKIRLYWAHTEKGYYNFVDQCQNEKDGENPFFGGPASNIETNISNGGVGYFVAYSLITIDTIIPED